MHPLLLDLQRALDRLGLALSQAQQAQLLAYLDLIAKWTQVYNLTAVRDAHEMLTHHLLDSLAVIAPLRRELANLAVSGGRVAPDAAIGLGAPPGPRLLDVGSGAGLPGVVIAIACPEIGVVCVDAVAKKAAFIQQVAAALQLPNLAGKHARVETIAEPFDVVCSRAFSSLADFVAWSTTARAPHGVWMAMKGKRPDSEVAALPRGVEVFHVEQLQVPGLDAERCLVWLRG